MTQNRNEYMKNYMRERRAKLKGLPDNSYKIVNVNKLTKVNNNKDIFGIRFYGFLAKHLGINSYSNLKLDELKKAIGKHLISN